MVDYQGVYSGAVITTHRFAGSAHNRLPKKIERCVYKNGNTGLLPEFIQKEPEERAGFATDCMNAGHSIRKPGGRNQTPLVISDV